MRINLKRKNGPRDTRRRIYEHLVLEFCDDYDLHAKDMSDYFSYHEKNLSVLIQYLKDKGYKVRNYSFTGSDASILSWGIEFDDDCDLTLAHKLRYSDGESE